MSFNMNKSKSRQQSASQNALAGTKYFDEYAKGFSGLGDATSARARGYANEPFGFFEGQSVDELVPTTGGLPNELNQYMTGIAENMFNKASAGGSQRGQLQPESTTGVVGSALQNIGQFLTPYITDWKKYMVGLPDMLKASKLGYMQNTLGALSPGLGATSSFSGKSDAFGFGVAGPGGSAGGGMSQGTPVPTSAAPVCWIAGVLYGEGSVEQGLIRTWLLAQTSPFWSGIRSLYVTFGKQVAEFIQPRQWAQTPFIPLFQWMLHQAQRGR